MIWILHWYTPTYFFNFSEIHYYKGFLRTSVGRLGMLLLLSEYIWKTLGFRSADSISPIFWPTFYGLHLFWLIHIVVHSKFLRIELLVLTVWLLIWHIDCWQRSSSVISPHRPKNIHMWFCSFFNCRSVAYISKLDQDKTSYF